MKLYTDYPLQENEHNKVCPVHQVEAISYDRDKYVEVIHPEFGVHYIKRGYLYEKEGQHKEMELHEKMLVYIYIRFLIDLEASVYQRVDP